MKDIDLAGIYILMNKVTGKPVLDDNGEEVASGTVFRPAASSGSVDAES